jgi:hypothetical protein
VTVSREYGLSASRFQIHDSLFVTPAQFVVEKRCPVPLWCFELGLEFALAQIDVLVIRTPVFPVLAIFRTKSFERDVPIFVLINLLT